eukprot:1314237-Rhodomonas_salina.1
MPELVSMTNSLSDDDREMIEKKVLFAYCWPTVSSTAVLGYCMVLGPCPSPLVLNAGYADAHTGTDCGVCCYAHRWTAAQYFTPWRASKPCTLVYSPTPPTQSPVLTRRMAYALATQSPVLACCMGLRACYAKP